MSCVVVLVVISRNPDNLLTVYPPESRHSTYRDRDRPAFEQQIKRVRNQSKNKQFSHSSVCLSPLLILSLPDRKCFLLKCLHDSDWPAVLFIMIEVKAEDVERSLFTHTALTDHNLDDPISPAAIYAQVSLTQTEHMSRLLWQLGCHLQPKTWLNLYPGFKTWKWEML